MDDERFSGLLAQLTELTADQLKQVTAHVARQEAPHERVMVREYRQASGNACPHCASVSVVKFGQRNGVQRYRCKGCSKVFSEYTGTPFHRLRNKEKLLAYAGCMVEGKSIRASAEETGLSVKQSFRWRHRFLRLAAQQCPEGLAGIVETDHTFFPKSYKGQKVGLPRAAKRRGAPPPDDAEQEPPVAVLVAQQRGSRRVLTRQLDNKGAAASAASLRGALSRDAIMSSDGDSTFGVVARTLKVSHGYFVSSDEGRGGKGVWHVQNANAYTARLKGWMHRFHGVATKYLQHYLGWRQLLDRFHDQMTARQFFFHALRTEYVNT